MRRASVAAVMLVALSLTACGGASRHRVVVLRMESPDAAGIEPDPAVAFFVRQVAQLSDGRLRIDVENYPRGEDGSVDETGALRAVADGDADLGWAHTGSFDAVGVHAFDALDAPMLIDNYSSETAVIRSDLAKRMLAGVSAAGLAGLALLAGPLDRLVGTSTPLHRAGDIRGRSFALRPSSVARMAVRALGGDPSQLSYQLVSGYPGLYVNAVQRPGPPAFLDDDLDSIFFDRYGGRCPTQTAGCETSRPWVITDVVLGPSTEAIVANPARLRGLSARRRSWLTRAAADAAVYSTRVADQDDRLVPELCAAGVRFSTAMPATVANLRRAWRPLYAKLESGPLGSAIRLIRALSSRTPAPASLRIPRGCHRQPRQPYTAHGVRSTLPDGVYRIQVTAADIRAAGAQGLGGVWPAVETLTLRDGDWRLDFAEPTLDAEYGTYAGTPLRTAWWTDRAGQVEESFFSVVVNRDALRFYIVQSWDDYRVEHALYASHLWQRIGG
jgi:TRAP-type C4-dicarboxylate transport system substrate-binding protein